jgi:hypothetical protein
MTTISQIAQQVLDQARTEGWKRAQVKAACYERKVPNQEREAIYAALGMAHTSPSQAASDAETWARARRRRPRPLFGNMDLSFPARDRLTGEHLAAGTRVIGFKVGGQWEFTAEPVAPEDFRKACEALLLSNDDDDGYDLDHEDLDLLAEFGRRYPRFAVSIGCDVPGLD